MRVLNFDRHFLKLLLLSIIVILISQEILGDSNVGDMLNILEVLKGTDLAVILGIVIFGLVALGWQFLSFAKVAMSGILSLKTFVDQTLARIDQFWDKITAFWGETNKVLDTHADILFKITSAQENLARSVANSDQTLTSLPGYIHNELLPLINGVEVASKQIEVLNTKTQTIHDIFKELEATKLDTTQFDAVARLNRETYLKGLKELEERLLEAINNLKHIKEEVYDNTAVQSDNTLS